MVEVRDLRMGSPAPNFWLRSHDGNVIELQSYRHKQPVVLIFAHDLACEHCQRMLQEFAGAYLGYQAEGVEILAVVPCSLADLAQPGRRLKLPFPVLCDENSHVRESYLGKDRAAIYVLDRYNAPQVKDAGADAVRLMSPVQALDWAVFSETTCPECRVLEWPEDK